MTTPADSVAPLPQVLKTARSVLTSLYIAIQSASARLDSLENLIQTNPDKKAFVPIVQRERITLDERLQRYHRRNHDFCLRDGEGEEYRRLVAAMVVQEAREWDGGCGEVGEVEFGWGYGVLSLMVAWSYGWEVGTGLTV
jgi:hypothetical protein